MKILVLTMRKLDLHSAAEPALLASRKGLVG